MAQGRNLFASLVLKWKGDAGAQKAQKAMNQVQQTANRATQSHVKTTLAAQNVVRVVQDLPFGMMGITNNLQSLADSMVYLKNQTGSWGVALKSTLRSVFKGPMALTLVVAVVTSLILRWDRLTAMWDKAKVKLGLLSQEQADYNEVLREHEKLLKEIEKLDFLQEEVADKIREEKLPEALRVLGEQYQELSETEESATQAVIDKTQELHELRSSTPAQTPDEIKQDENTIARTEEIARKQRELNKAKAEAAIQTRRLVELETLRTSVANRQIKLMSGEKARDASGLPEDFFTKPEDTDKAKKTLLDYQRWRVRTLRFGRERAVLQARIEKEETLKELREIRDSGVITTQQFATQRENVLKAHYQRVSDIIQQTAPQMMESAAQTGFLRPEHLDEDGALTEENLMDRIEDRVGAFDWEIQMLMGQSQRYLDVLERRKMEEERIAQESAANRRRVITGSLANLTQASQGFFDIWKQERERELDQMNLSEEQKTKILEEEGKKRFNIMKAIAIADTLVSTYAAAQQAYEAGAKIHPILGAAFAATATAAGLARVQAIRKQRIGGSGGGGGSNAGGSGAQSGFTTLNANVVRDRAANFETNTNNRASNGQNQQVDRFTNAVDRFEKAAQNMRVTIDDPTMGEVARQGSNYNTRYNQ